MVEWDAIYQLQKWTFGGSRGCPLWECMDGSLYDVNEVSWIYEMKHVDYMSKVNEVCWYNVLYDESYAYGEYDVPSLSDFSISAKVGVVVLDVLSHCTKCNLGVVLEYGFYVKFLNASMILLSVFSKWILTCWVVMKYAYPW